MFRPTQLQAAITLSAVLAGLACPNTSQADLVYRPNEGWSREGGFFGSSSAIAKTADLQLQYGQDLEKKGDLAGARDAYKRLLKVFPLAQQTSEARIRLAGILEKQGRFEEAFDSYDELVQKNPESKEFIPALDAMFNIAKRYMNGEKRRLFGVKMFASNQRAEEMFDTILKRAPFSRSAAQVMLFRGMMMERQGKDAEALSAYQQIIERFPSDSIADEAQYQMGYIRLRSVKEGSYDHTDRVRAQESFEDFVNRAPQNGRIPQARENLQLIEANAAKASLEVAKFYDKTEKFKAAVLSYQDVIRDHPNSKEADLARKRIAALRQEKGEEVLETGVSTAPTSEKGPKAKQVEAKVNTTTRADYVGPQIKKPAATTERAPAGPALRLQEADAAPPPTSAQPLNLSLPAPRLTPPAPQNP
jgi:outer membrane protein assembly factor BamD